MFALLLSVALNATAIDYEDLGKYYWDCDTKYMLQTMSGQDLNSCISITEEFKKHFTPDGFVRYWNANKQKQWAVRGYTPVDNAAK